MKRDDPAQTTSQAHASAATGSTAKARTATAQQARRAERRSALVQRRDHLSGAHQVVLRREQRRRRRFSRPDRETRLHRRTRRECDLAAAVLSVATARRRLRHRRLPQRASRLRPALRREALHSGSACARHPRDYRTGHQPHVGSASMVSARAPREAGFESSQLLRVVRYRSEVSRKRGSSSSIRSRRTGRTIRSRARTTGTASIRTSPI